MKFFIVSPRLWSNLHKDSQSAYIHTNVVKKKKIWSLAQLQYAFLHFHRVILKAIALPCLLCQRHSISNKRGNIIDIALIV